MLGGCTRSAIIQRFRGLGFAPSAIDEASLVIGHAVDVPDVRIVLVREIRDALLLPFGDITPFYRITAIRANRPRVFGSDISVTIEPHGWMLPTPLTGGPRADGFGGEKITSDGRIRLTNRA